jgi:ATP-dependent protease ClpP protease subunit
MQLRALVIGAALALTAGPAAAAEIRHRPVGDGAGFISIEGQIHLGDELAFAEAASQYQRAAVLLVSPGGSAIAGMAMGETIRTRRFSTGVAPGTVCASACALAWLGGVSRVMSATSRIGFHAVFQEERDGPRVSSIGNALAGAYAQKMGLSAEAIALIVRADPTGMEWLTPAKAKAAGIAFSILEIEAPSGNAAPEAQPRKHFVTGLDPSGDNWLALKAAPDIRSARMAKLLPGTGLHVIQRADRWLLVELADGRSGWVASDYVGCCR